MPRFRGMLDVVRSTQVWLRWVETRVDIIIRSWSVLL